MRRTSAVLASIHAVEPVSIFTRAPSACLSLRLGSPGFTGWAGRFRFCEKSDPFVTYAFHGATSGGGGAADDQVRRDHRFLPGRVLSLEAGEGPHDGQVGEAGDVLADGGQV